MSKENLNNKYCNMFIIPCKPNSKAPATRNGFKDGRKNFDAEKAIRSGYNIGLSLSMSNLICIDADVDLKRGLNGIETIKELEKKLGVLPLTLTQSTPRGGRHYIFDVTGVENPIGKIGKDIDVKHNGYILLAPSQINGKSYQIINGEENGNLYVVKLPDNWRKYINRKHTKREKCNKHSVFKPKRKINIDEMRLFNNCAFLKYCADNAEILPEPMWHSMVTVLAQIPNSEQLIHELSSPYPEYNFSETAKKISYAQEFGYPQSCKYISSNYPDICAGCDFAVKNNKEI